jgi:hypothetical protein
LPTRLALRRDDGTAERFETMFREMDADGSGRVDFEEFFAYFRRLKKERAAEIVASAVIRFDAIATGDGDDDDEKEEDATTPPTRDPSRVGGVSANEASRVSPNTAASKKWTAGRAESQSAGSFRAKLALRRTANETRA